MLACPQTSPPWPGSCPGQLAFVSCGTASVGTLTKFEINVSTSLPWTGSGPWLTAFVSCSSMSGGTLTTSTTIDQPDGCRPGCAELQGVAGLASSACPPECLPQTRTSPQILALSAGLPQHQVDALWLGGRWDVHTTTWNVHHARAKQDPQGLPYQRLF